MNAPDDLLDNMLDVERMSELVFKLPNTFSQNSVISADDFEHVVDLFLEAGWKFPVHYHVQLMHFQAADGIKTQDYHGFGQSVSSGSQRCRTVLGRGITQHQLLQQLGGRHGIEIRSPRHSLWF